MLISSTIRCDWPGCGASITVENKPGAIKATHWKAENDGCYSLHLCPDHKRQDWFAVRGAQFKAHVAKAHSTP
jgi:hypothetical protein